MDAEKKYEEAFLMGRTARIHGSPRDRCPFRKGGLRTVEMVDEKVPIKENIPPVWYDGWMMGWEFQDNIYRLRDGTYVSPTTFNAA